MKIKPLPLPSREELLAAFDYNPLTGNIIKKKTQYSMGENVSKGYYRVFYKKRKYYAHRLIWKMHHGVDPINIDHINRNIHDNRIENLREVDQTQNLFNSARRKDNTSGVKGVCYHKTRQQWVASVDVKGKKFCTYHINKEDAICSVRKLREKHHGEFAKH